MSHTNLVIVPHLVCLFAVTLRPGPQAHLRLLPDRGPAPGPCHRWPPDGLREGARGPGPADGGAEGPALGGAVWSGRAPAAGEDPMPDSASERPWGHVTLLPGPWPHTGPEEGAVHSGSGPGERAADQHLRAAYPAGNDNTSVVIARRDLAEE